MAPRAAPGSADGRLTRDPADRRTDISPRSPGTAPTAAELLQTAHQVQAGALAAGITLATAESCTGGLVGHVLTEVAGSSGYFVGGIVSYADDVKMGILGVDRGTLERHGAVSEEVAKAMAEGVRAVLRADVGLSVTGIAGPAAHRTGKPVGLTFVAMSDRDGTAVRRYVWTGDRSANKRSSAQAALRLLLERLQGAPDRGHRS